VKLSLMMAKGEKKMKVGDYIYASKYGLLVRLQIVKETPKQVFLDDGTKLWKTDSEYIRAVGQSTWDLTSYYKENEKLSKRFDRQQLSDKYFKVKREIDNINPISLTDEQINQFVEFCKIFLNGVVR